MAITFRGNPITLQGAMLQPGDSFPEFTLTDQGFNAITRDSLSGIKVFLTVPSLDTGVCDMEVKKFNEQAISLAEVTVYAVSMDLPFAQSRWCQTNTIKKVVTLSDYKAHSFGRATGTLIQGLALLARAVFIVDENNRITYAEYVPEVTDHPQYTFIFEKLKEMTS